MGGSEADPYYLLSHRWVVVWPPWIEKSGENHGIHYCFFILCSSQKCKKQVPHVLWNPIFSSDFPLYFSYFMLCMYKIEITQKKSCIRETKNLSTTMDSSTDTKIILLSKAEFAQKQTIFVRRFENQGGLMNNRACALKYHLIKSKSPKLHVHPFGWHFSVCGIT